jgi:hypothetical protein
MRQPLFRARSLCDVLLDNIIIAVFLFHFDHCNHGYHRSVVHVVAGVVTAKTAPQERATKARVPATKSTAQTEPAALTPACGSALANGAIAGTSTARAGPARLSAASTIAIWAIERAARSHIGVQNYRG